MIERGEEKRIMGMKEWKENRPFLANTTVCVCVWLKLDNAGRN